MRKRERLLRDVCWLLTELRRLKVTLGADSVERLRGSLPVPTHAFAFMAK